MSNELTLSGSLEYLDSLGIQSSLAISDLIRTLTTAKCVHTVLTIATTETAIEKGDIATPKWFMCINRDTTNYIELKCATSGTIFAKLMPGDFCIVPLGSGALAPFAIANVANCLLEILVIAL